MYRYSHSKTFAFNWYLDLVFGFRSELRAKHYMCNTSHVRLAFNHHYVSQRRKVVVLTWSQMTKCISLGLFTFFINIRSASALTFSRKHHIIYWICFALGEIFVEQHHKCESTVLKNCLGSSMVTDCRINTMVISKRVQWRSLCICSHKMIITSLIPHHNVFICMQSSAACSVLLLLY